MNHTLRTLISAQPKEWREAFFTARAELSSAQELSEYDKATEAFLMDERRERCVGKADRHDSVDRKRVERMQVK
jgi:hypothetical protein